MARTTTHSANNPLHAALSALRSQDHGAARDALVLAWRERRSPVLAELVGVLDGRAPDRITTQLAAVLTPRVTTSHANLRALDAVDDPRLSAFALDALERLPFTAVTAEDLLMALVGTVARHRDPRLAARLPAIVAAVTTRIGRLSVRNALVESVKVAVATCPSAREPTAEELATEAMLLALVEPLRRTTRSAASLQAEIYAHPADDGPRLVYADLLSENGDPRGEFILLQVERERTGMPVSAREQELLKKHGKAWLGDLAPVLSWGKGYSSTTFRRGFVAQADIILSVGKKLQPLLGSEAWATVEGFADNGGGRGELLERAPLRALRSLKLSAVDVEALARRAEPLAAVVWVQVDQPVPRRLLGAAFPNLVSVVSWRPTLTMAEVVAFAACGTEHVELHHYYVSDSLEEARRAFDAFIDGLVGTAAQLARLSLAPPFDRHPVPAPIELRRGAAGRWERVPGSEGDDCVTCKEPGSGAAS